MRPLRLDGIFEHYNNKNIKQNISYLSKLYVAWRGVITAVRTYIKTVGVVRTTFPKKNNNKEKNIKNPEKFGTFIFYEDAPLKECK